MDTSQMRTLLKDHYGHGSSFASRLDKMPDNQVIAIFRRLQEKGVMK